MITEEFDKKFDDNQEDILEYFDTSDIKLIKIDYLEERAKRGSAERMLEILKNVPDVEPDEKDRL